MLRGINFTPWVPEGFNVNRGGGGWKVVGMPVSGE